jgi:rhamnose utilization protein RhaD (predicted bifunctional aldolase and dehydrogenase)
MAKRRSQATRVKLCPEFDQLRNLSAQLGSDPLLVQAAGGNTSIKVDGIMWIKASGTWLRDAVAKDLFVPLDMVQLKEALHRDDPRCEDCMDFVRVELNPLGLRPSIETSVHGLMSQRVVLHVHCVNTLAWMIQEDAGKSWRRASLASSGPLYLMPGLVCSLPAPSAP